MKNNYDKITVLMVIAWLILALLVLISSNTLISDEAIYNKNLTSPYPPFSYDFIVNFKGTAGILSTWFQLLIYPITKGNVNIMRFTNIIWLFFSAVILNKIINDKKNTNYRYSGFLIIFLPSTYILCARNMGDFPSYFFAIFFYYLYDKSKKENKNLLYFIFTGLVGSIAIVGKQTLLLLFVIPLYSFVRESKHKIKIVVMFIAMLILPSIIYIIWGSYIPKSSSFNSMAKSPLLAVNLNNFFLEFLYISTINIILFPSYSFNFIKKYFKLIIPLTLVLFFWQKVPIPFFNTNFKFFKSSSIYIVYGNLWNFIVSFFKVLGIFFFLKIVIAQLKKPSNIDILIIISLGLMIFLKIPYYDERYIAIFSPFFLLILIDFHKVKFQLAGLYFGLFLNTFTLTLLLLIY